ncbi:MAG: hypothetical protein MJ014_04120 [Methanocorpusculum sp.]|nr:hypothetical protein [Methanocorpusculum sp.]
MKFAIRCGHRREVLEEFSYPRKSENGKSCDTEYEENGSQIVWLRRSADRGILLHRERDPLTVNTQPYRN